jgi:hypothetical protein
MPLAVTAATPAEEAQARITQRQGQAAQAGVPLRTPPPLPTTCCGRGCSGCVWEGYFDAVTGWLEDADAALGHQDTAKTPPPDQRPCPG